MKDHRRKTDDTKRTLIREAISVLGPMVYDEPTEDQFQAFMQWADRKELGPATAMEVYENAVLLLRRGVGGRQINHERST